ncbi:MAG TPA: RagB/SusD family nutrient uptake outer membrane protein [Puia sp.]|nr:RagB/SusD family nutrient uptake outer membrane protein [Puia sp.]
MGFVLLLRGNRLVALLLLPVFLQACHKNFLDAKPSSTISVPTTLSDFQALLDNNAVFNQVPTLGEASCDDYFFTYSAWQTVDIRQQNAFLWAKDIFEGQGGQLDWNAPYEQVFYANVVLDGLGHKPEADSVSEWESLEGAALFARAFAFYNLSQVFAPPYGTVADTAHLGIPLRLHSEISSVSTRSTLPQTYQQIINDLDSAEAFLPVVIPANNASRNRPVRVAAQALLARVYLSMRNYPLARAYADSALRFYDSLIDYNSLDTTASIPVGMLNNETIYQAGFLGSNQFLGSYFCAIAGGFFSGTRIDSSLISSYDPNDLRRVVYYHYKPDNSSYLKGSYTGTNICFGGLATDELYLIRAEGAARAGDYLSAIRDVDTLLVKRWRTGSFPGYTVASWQEALDTVLLERRKELAFRGLRWTDLRRLNAEDSNIVLTRNQGGFSGYTLEPKSDLYTMPIPPDVLNLTGMQQNPGR